MPLYTADAIFSPEKWLEQHCLEVDVAGRIQCLRPLESGDEPIRLSGVLVPGWVNAHCHLELSALAGRIPEETGMTGFIGGIFRERGQVDEATLEQAVEKSLEYLAETGTAAVGDISNLPVSAGPKLRSAVYTHTFIELLGLDPMQAEERFQQGKNLSFAYRELPHTLTPHAPYSTSSELFHKIYESGQERYSLHLMESLEEVELFQTGGGAFKEFYDRVGLDFVPFAHRDPRTHALEHFPREKDIMLVHLTELAVKEVAPLVEAYPQAMACLCPRSNWYIHRRQPAVITWAEFPSRVCLGTDSAASNYNLDLWEEVKWLQEQFSDLSLHTTVRWATNGGARALGIEEKFGNFMPGMTPGVLHLEEVRKGGDGEYHIQKNTQVKVLARAKK